MKCLFFRVCTKYSPRPEVADGGRLLVTRRQSMIHDFVRPGNQQQSLLSLGPDMPEYGDGGCRRLDCRPSCCGRRRRWLMAGGGAGSDPWSTATQINARASILHPTCLKSRPEAPPTCPQPYNRNSVIQRTYIRKSAK